MTQTSGQLGLSIGADSAVPPVPAVPPGRDRHPGPRWVRKAPADDCSACWAQQHTARVLGRAVPFRRRAVWTLVDGHSRTHLCATHRAAREDAERLAAGRTGGAPC